jgi:hypothetical protein
MAVIRTTGVTERVFSTVGGFCQSGAMLLPFGIHFMFRHVDMTVVFGIDVHCVYSIVGFSSVCRG